ncbi:sialate O-acetylesterase [Microbulbifer sp. ALW1]|uniref:sialate O-acetylesterase n=1 Tax=Microbulbifer sp. (strain ALW1) TaxID=1516059 RepID=UPI001357667B|nr:sialate O-acetylesterase [Microbulbifer sp. ALW1]
MKIINLRFLFLLSLLAASPLQAKTYQVYFLGGQSNMVGFGFNRDLPEVLQSPISKVRIFNGAPRMDEATDGGNGHWTALQPGFGLNSDYQSGKYVFSDRFGPEVSFGHTIQQLAPDENVALIKYAWGGSALVDGASGFGSWDPNVSKVNQYDYFLNAVSQALGTADIDGDGEEDTLVPAGILWMQGEADAFDNERAAVQYLDNLNLQVKLMRAALHNNALPVVIGRITDSKRGQAQTVMQFSESVRNAQKAFTEIDRCAALSTATEDFAYADGDDWHYRSEGYIALGRDFAQKLHALKTQCARG